MAIDTNITAVRVLLRARACTPALLGRGCCAVCGADMPKAANDAGYFEVVFVLPGRERKSINLCGWECVRRWTTTVYKCTLPETWPSVVDRASMACSGLTPCLLPDMDNWSSVLLWCDEG